MQPLEQISSTGCLLDRIGALRRGWNKNKTMKYIFDKSQHSQQITYLLYT
jgi:hypothetical protein